MSRRGCWAGSAVLAVLHLSPLLWEQHLIILLHIVPTNASPAATEILTGSVAPQFVFKVGFVTVSKAAPAAGGLTASVPAVGSGQFAGNLGYGWTVPCPAKVPGTLPQHWLPWEVQNTQVSGARGVLNAGHDLCCASLSQSYCALHWRGALCLLPVLLPLGHLFPSPFAIFTACFPCFPSCICKAASNKALADNLILKHNESCSFH